MSTERGLSPQVATYWVGQLGVGRRLASVSVEPDSIGTKRCSIGRVIGSTCASDAIHR